MSTEAPKPDTIVLVHGFWVTPRSWEAWISHFEGRGFRVLAPAYPGFEVEVEELNADPTPVEHVTVPQIIEHLETVVGGLDTPPIIMGHSAGGVFTQILLDHGLGAAGVAINSAPTEGVKRVPLSQIRSTFPVLKNPANRHRAVGFTHEQWQYTFTNGFSDEEYAAPLRALPHPRVRGDLLGQRAGQHPSRQGRHLGRLPQREPGAAAVHLRKRRPPDAAKSPAVQRQALQGPWPDHRGQGVPRTPPAAVVAGMGSGRRLRPRLGPRPRSTSEPMTLFRLIRIGGPTTLLEIDGWRVSTDPTFDDPGRT